MPRPEPKYFTIHKGFKQEDKNFTIQKIDLEQIYDHHEQSFAYGEKLFFDLITDLDMTLICQMSPVQINEYVRTMEDRHVQEWEQERKESKEKDAEIEALKKEIEALRKENIGLKSQNGSLREDLYIQELKLSLLEDPEQDDERVLIGTEFIDNDKAWENFKASKDKLWKACFFECNEFEFYPKNIQYWEWNVRNEDGDIIAQGDKKPKKQDIFAHWRNGITIRLYAFNDRDERTLITHFNGQEWSYEEAV